MKRSSAIWLIVAASLVFAGSVIFGGVLAANKWDMKKLSNVEYQEKSYDITEEYSGISVLTDTARVDFVATERDSCRVECVEPVKAAHAVEVRDGILTVEIEDTRKWYERIGIFSIESPRITVYLPEGEYGALSVKGSTGDVWIQSKLSFEKIDVSVSTGDVECFASAEDKISVRTTTGQISLGYISASELDLAVSTGTVRVLYAWISGDVALTVRTGSAVLENIICKDLRSIGTTGDVDMKNVVAENAISIERDTGEISFVSCDAAELNMTTDTGDIKGSLRSAKTFSVSHTTGTVRLPEEQTGGRFTVKTDTGDIIISVEEKKVQQNSD